MIGKLPEEERINPRQRVSIAANGLSSVVWRGYAADMQIVKRGFPRERYSIKLRTGKGATALDVQVPDHGAHGMTETRPEAL
jgi:hypothetical protein